MEIKPMKKHIETAVTHCADQISNPATDAISAQQYAQAVANLVHALECMERKQLKSED